MILEMNHEASAILLLMRTNCFNCKWSGSSDGQTKVVREGDNGVAYAWNMREQKWDKVITNFISILGYCTF